MIQPSPDVFIHGQREKDNEVIVSVPGSEMEQLGNRFTEAALMMGSSLEQVAINIKRAIEALGGPGTALKMIEAREALRRVRAWQGVWIFGDWKYGGKS